MDLQNLVSLNNVQESKKVFQVEPLMAMKLTSAVIATFNASISIKEKMNGLQIYEAATLFLNQYPYESISDLMLCLRMVKTGQLGIIYNAFDSATMFNFFTKYMDLKWEAFDNNLSREKSHREGSVNTPQVSMFLQRIRNETDKAHEQDQKDAREFWKNAEPNQQ